MNWGEFLDSVIARVADGSVAGMIPEWFNDCQLEMMAAAQWRHLDKSLVVPTRAPLSAGTVAIANGSDAVVGTGTAFDAACGGQLFQLFGDGNYYKIVAAADPTHLTIESAFIGTTVAASAYLVNFYAQTRPDGFDPQRMYDVVLQVGKGAHRPLNFVAETEMFQVWANESFRRGVPEYFRMFDNQVLLFPVPDAAYNIQYFYAKKPALADPAGPARTFQPDWDDEHMRCLVTWVWELFLLWDKDTDYIRVGKRRLQQLTQLIRKNNESPSAQIRFGRWDEGYYGGRLRPPRFPVTIGS